MILLMQGATLKTNKYCFEQCLQAETRKPVDLMPSDYYTVMWSKVNSLLAPWRVFVPLRITLNLIQTLQSALRPPEHSSSKHYLQITGQAIS